MSKSLVIIGGGLGGLSLALIAAKKNWKVKIIEKSCPKTLLKCFIYKGL